MEAATPLRPPAVRTFGDRLLIDGLVVDDSCVVRLVGEREEAGDDPVKAVRDALEIGARVLDREQAEAHADFVRAEFDKVSREVEGAFSDRARQVVDDFGRRLDAVFQPESGHLSRALERHFSDGSSHAVQNRVKQLVAEVMQSSREDLLRQFSSADGHNPLAEFKVHTIRALHQAGERQEVNLRAVVERMTALQQEVQALRAEREKLEELAEERERGTAKGRTFEEQVAAALDAIACVQGDDCESVGDLRGANGKAGDVVVAIEGCRGPARGRIVFEAKTGKLSRPAALKELDQGKAARDADFAVLVVPSDDKVPAKMRPLREYNGDKLIVTYDARAEGRLTLEVAYALARARVLMARSEAEGIDAAAIRDVIERALLALEDVRKVRSQLTGAKNAIDNADGMVVEMADRVRDHLRDIDRLAQAAGEAGAAGRP